MKTVAILSICLLLSATAACAPSSAPSDGPSATPTLVVTTEATVTRTPRPTSTPVVVDGVGAIAATIQLPNLGALFPAFGAGAVWVPGHGILTRIDPVTMEVVSTATLDGGQRVEGPYAVAIEGTTIWATEKANKALVRIHPDTNQIVDRIELNIEGELHAIALDGTTIWVAVRGLNQLLQVDTVTRQIIASIPVDDPTSIAIGYGSAWVVEHHKGNLVRIDPNTGSVVARIQLGTGRGSPGQVAIGEGGVWVGQLDGQMVSRVDPKTNQEIAQIELGLLVLSVETSPGTVWAVVSPFEGCGGSGVVRIDPNTNRALGKIPVRCAGDIAVGPDNLWVTSFQYREITVITPAE